MNNISTVVFFVIAMWGATATVSCTEKKEVGADGAGTTALKKDTLALIAKGWVGYSDFGAKGDGKTDDVAAIADTHIFANRHGLTVRVDKEATYYIGGKNHIVDIRTNTDFGNAAFIIDDTNVQKRDAPVFSVNSSRRSVRLEGVATLKKNQLKIDVSLPGAGLVTATDTNTKRYIRYGANQNNGSPQTDIFAVNKSGEVDKNTPVIWDFDQITEITFLPIDETTLTITGGRFTTIANREGSQYNYYTRGLVIKRSNVVIDGLEHRVTGEGETGAPYNGFININNCSNVTVRNTILTGRKTYQTIGSAGSTVSMGSYDIIVNRALNVTFENCRQTNDINDGTYWGIIGSNYCKNLVYDNCSFSRFDAHMGVANATIRNSTLGHQGINAIGSGLFTVENSTIASRTLINLRSDYGSTWEGEFIIRDCVFRPTGMASGNVSLIGGTNSGQHNFGYRCYMPGQITIENLRIEDTGHPAEYRGAAIFANFNKQMTDDTYVEQYPYIRTKKVILKNVTASSGKPLRRSDNAYMFKDVIIEQL